MTLPLEESSIPDLIRDEHGSVALPTPQTTIDVIAAVTVAAEAAKKAYRVAYTAADGDLEDDTVDSLDLAATVLTDLVADLTK